MATPPSNVQSSSMRKSLGYEPNAGWSSADGGGSFECESFEQDAKKQRPSSSRDDDNGTHFDPAANVDVSKRPLFDARVALEKCIGQAYNLAMQNARNAKQNDSLEHAKKMMHDHLDALYYLLPENLRALVRQWSKGDQAGLYVLLKEFYIKIGESMNLENRTTMQDYIERLVLLYQDEIDEKGYAPDDLVDRLLQLQLPMLKGHDISRAKRTRNKIKRQIVELIFHAVYDIKINPAFEFIFQTPDEDLRLVTDTAAFKSSLRAHLEFPTIDAPLSRCDKVMDIDSWTTAYSFLYSNNTSIGQYFPSEYQHVTGYLCEQNVNISMYAGLQDSYPLSPYLECIEPLINKMQVILCNDKISGEDESALQRVLAKIHDKPRHDPPSSIDHATTAIQVLERIFETVPKSTLLRMRMTTIDAIKYHHSEWFQEQFGNAIEIECSVAGGVRGEQVGAANRMELYNTASGHSILTRDSHWNIYAVTMSNQDAALDSIRSYCDESALLNMFGFLDDDELERIQEQMLSHSMLVAGLEGSIARPDGSMLNARHYTLPEGIGAPSYVPAGLPSIQKILGGIYYVGILRIYQILGEEHFNKLVYIISGDSKYLEETPLSPGYLERQQAQQQEQRNEKRRKVTILKQQHEAGEVVLSRPDLAAVEARQQQNEKRRKVTILKQQHEAGEVVLSGKDLAAVEARQQKYERQNEKNEKKRTKRKTTTRKRKTALIGLSGTDDQLRSFACNLRTKYHDLSTVPWPDWAQLMQGHGFQPSKWYDLNVREKVCQYFDLLKASEGK